MIFSDLPIWFAQSLAFRDVIFNLERLGLFDFILPLLLMFAVIFGVLSWTNIFGGNKGINVTISLVISLLAIRFPIYTDFLNIISPKLAIGIVILLFIVILTGLFVPEGAQAIIGWVMIAVGVIIAIVILSQTYSAFFGGYGGFNSDLIAWVIIIALLIGVLVVIVVANNAGRDPPSKKLGRLFSEIIDGAKGKTK